MQKYLRMARRHGKRLHADFWRPKLLNRTSTVSLKDYCIEESDLSTKKLKKEMPIRSLNRYLDDLDLESEFSRSVSDTDSKQTFYIYFGPNL